MSESLRVATKSVVAVHDKVDPRPVSLRPTEAQRRYLQRGLDQPGGKLPLFDMQGQEIDRKTVESCIDHGWAEPWFANPLKPDWIVCRLSPAGYVLLGEEPPAASD